MEQTGQDPYQTSSPATIIDYRSCTLHKHILHVYWKMPTDAVFKNAHELPCLEIRAVSFKQWKLMCIFPHLSGRGLWIVRLMVLLLLPPLTPVCHACLHLPLLLLLRLRVLLWTWPGWFPLWTWPGWLPLWASSVDLALHILSDPD